MTAIIIAAAVLVWFGCGLLAVYLEARRIGDLNTDNRMTIFGLGLIALLLVIVDCIGDAGARRHREGK